MKLNLLFLCITLAVGCVSAQATAPTAYINDVNVDPIAQSGTITAISDLGFPIGERAIQVTLRCQTTGATVKTYKSDGMGAYSSETDPAALSVISSSKLVQTSSTAVQVRSTGGILRMFCKDRVLYTDFSGAFSPGSRPNQDDLGDGHVRLRRWPSSGTVDVTYPIFAQPGTGQTDFFDFFVSLDGKTLTAAQSIADIVIGYTGGENKVGVFLYDAKRNVLIPLRYGGNSSGIAAVRGTKVGGLLEVYFAVDYTVDSDWRKLSIDFKKSLVWNEPASKPAGAKFGR